MLTVRYAKAYPRLRVDVGELRYTATDLNGFRGAQSVEEEAAVIVRAATLSGLDAPAGCSFDTDEAVP